MRAQLFDAEKQLVALKADLRMGMQAALEERQHVEENLFLVKMADAKTVGRDGEGAGRGNGRGGSQKP